MLSELENLKAKAFSEIEKAKTKEELDRVRVFYLGRKGELTKLLKGIKNLPDAEKKSAGSLANEIKNELAEKIQNTGLKISREILDKTLQEEWIDVTAEATVPLIGHLHPITKIRRKIEQIFVGMGFRVMEGPEVEKEFYNFEALNIPKNHPARDLMDTFWLKGGNLLRTHTSAVQIRTMEKENPPLRIIAPGRVYRYEAIDASHEATFHQVEGLMVGDDVTLANLKGILEIAVQKIFGKETHTRLRPGYFPFVEPGFELDMTCNICKGAGCPVCKRSGWIEIIPCGMVHPNVLRNVGYDPKKVQGFAFGMGLDRITMMKYGINDIRLFYQGDLRFLEQF